jgi:hypothetical protein
MHDNSQRMLDRLGQAVFHRRRARTRDLGDTSACGASVGLRSIASKDWSVWPGRWQIHRDRGVQMALCLFPRALVVATSRTKRLDRAAGRVVSQSCAPGLTPSRGDARAV